MIEIVSTRHNEMIDPLLHVWGWEIPVYLFLGGWVAGMMIIAGYFLFKGRAKAEWCSCLVLPTISLIFLSLGMLALFLDLEHKLYVWRLYTTFEIASPMSWGAWILLLVYPGLLANMIIRIPPFLAKPFPRLKSFSAMVNEHPVAIKTIGVINMLLGGMLGIYTGILLSSLGARPFWNSSILGFLFLVSGLSTAAAFVHMVAKDRYERELLAKADNAFLTIELFVLGLFLIGLLTATEVHQRAAHLVLGGEYTAFFWVIVVFMGIVIPLIYQSLAVNHKVPHLMLMPILVIWGGLMLRFVIVVAGQHSHWAQF
ncbi:MAG: polysulfide reductase [Gemmatimonadetes bacterium]|nr:MAG: polysulfide reductase [Gemmatimonadota bacterium]